MLCSITPSKATHIPNLGIFLFYVDPQFESEASEPPLLRLARTIKKEYPRVDGMLLVKDESGQYSARRGCITMCQKRYLFTKLDLSSSMNLYLDFHGERTALQNDMILADSLQLSLHPPLGLMLKWENGELKAKRERLNIGKFLESTTGRAYLDEWVAGLVHLYAQPTHAALNWLWERAHGEKRVQPISGHNLYDLTKDLRTKQGLFLAWFPDAKPRNLAEWIEKLSTQKLKPDDIVFLNQHGPFASGYYIVGVQGRKEKPKVIFCDSVLTEWDLHGQSEVGTETSDRSTGRKKKKEEAVKGRKHKTGDHERFSLEYAEWNLYLGFGSPQNSSAYGWRLTRRDSLYLLPFVPYPLGPVRVREDLQISDWREKASDNATGSLSEGVRRHANAFAKELNPVFGYYQRCSAKLAVEVLE